MFDDVSVVTTAVSSFNNAALASPYFLVVAMFSIPLFLMVFWYGRDLVSRIGWKSTDIESKTGLLSIAALVVWLLLFGGNYAVIRDGISWLPLAIAGILFVSVAFLVALINPIKYIGKIKDKKLRWGLFLAVLVVTGFSAMPTWWGILLQVSAFLCGVIVGDRLRVKISKISDMVLSTSIFTVMSILVLMQPEYFRFGQLGNLTLIHILALLLCGFLGITSLVTKYTNARSRIHKSAYIKLKWLCRILMLLALILFVLTESVPVFVALIGFCGLSEMLSIYHGNQDFKGLSGQSWALLLISFGIMIICPIITVFGIIYLLYMSNKLDVKDYTKLL